MVRAEIFGLDPLLIFAICMIGIIILAFITLSNEDPLLVLIIGVLLIASTFILGNLFEYDIYGFSTLFKYAAITLFGVPGQQIWLLGYMYLGTKELQPIVNLITVVKYIVVAIILFLTVIKGYNALRGGWKTLKPDQFKEK